MECLNMSFHNLKMTNSPFIIGQRRSIKNDQEFSHNTNDDFKSLNGLVRKMTLTEKIDLLPSNHKDRALSENSCENDNQRSTDEEDDLIERGPTNSRCRRRSHPYNQSSESLSSCSESSQGSPLNYTSERCSSSGGLLLVNNFGSSLQNVSTEESLVSSENNHNRHTYIHKNGGHVQVINQRSSLSENFTQLLPESCSRYDSYTACDLVTNLQCTQNKMCSTSCYNNDSLLDFSKSRFSNGSIEILSQDEYSTSDMSFNSSSPYSQSSTGSPSECLSNLSPDVENIVENIVHKGDSDFNHLHLEEGSDLNFNSKIIEKSENTVSSEDDMPEDLKEFISEFFISDTSKADSLSPQQYSEVIEDLLKQQPSTDGMAENSKIECQYINRNIQENNSPQMVTPTVSKMNGSLPTDKALNGVRKNSSSTIQISNTPFVNNLFILNNPPLILKNSPVVIINSGEKNLFVNHSQTRLRPLAPKPLQQKETVIDSSDSSEIKKSSPVYKAQEMKKLREVILSKFSEDEKRKQHCMITKIPDEKIIQTFEEGDTLLHIAIWKDVLTSVYLIDRFANLSALNVLNGARETPLLNAVIAGQVDLIKYLLIKGADPNIGILDNGSTVLHYAAQKGRKLIDVLETLCQCPNIQVDFYNLDGKTPLMNAVDSHDRELKENNPAVKIDSIPTIEMLLQYNAKISCHDRCNGKTVLHNALEKKNLQLLQVLCSKSQEIKNVIDSTTFEGNTPLHLIASMNDCDTKLRLDLMNLLIRNGASVKALNCHNKIPADLVDKNCKEVKKLLSLPRHL